MAHFLWIRRLLVGRKYLRELLAVTVRRFRNEKVSMAVGRGHTDNSEGVAVGLALAYQL
jgi:hypothetical protein